MNPNAILGKYLIKQIVINFLAVLLMVMGIVLMFEVIELLRRTSDRTDVDAWFIMQMAVTKLPRTLEMVFPFVMMIAAMITFWRLSKSNEFVIIRRRFHLGLSDTGAVCRFYGRRFEHYGHQSDFGADVRGL